jgi:hypothetical protein
MNQGVIDMRDDIFRTFIRPEPSGPAPVIKGISLRIPADLLAYVDSMAEHADLSRNAMGTLLLQWGIDHALLNLPEEICDQIHVEVLGEDYWNQKESINNDLRPF